MIQVTHTIRRAAGGRCHFARVSISNASESTVAASSELPLDWIVAAEAGIEFALRKIGSAAKVCVIDIQGTISDTREDTVFVASAIATFKLLGVTSYFEEFKEEKWKISGVVC